MMFRFFLIVALSFPVVAHGQSSVAACRLPSGLWAKRQALQKDFERSNDESGGAFRAMQSVDAQYRGFLVAAGDAYASGQAAVVNSCCDAVKGDLEASIFCGLLRYLEGRREYPDRFLAALPATGEGVSALIDLDLAAAQGEGTSSPATMPVYNVTDELYRLLLAGNEAATQKYFWLLGHSGGAYADDAADQLEDLLSNHPDGVIRGWPVLRKYWDLSEGITWDVDAAWWQQILKDFRARCRPNDPRCAEIIGLLAKATRAAGGR